MEEEFNLSEHLEHVYNMKYGKQAVKDKYIKEFIERLKDIVEKTHDKGQIDVSYLFNCIDKLAGDKLK